MQPNDADFMIIVGEGVVIVYDYYFHFHIAKTVLH